MHAQHATMHMQYATMQYPCATLVCIIQHAQPKDQSSWISPQGDFPPLHAFGEDFEVVNLPRNIIMLGTNGRTCQGSSDIKVVHTALAVPKGRV